MSQEERVAQASDLMERMALEFGLDDSGTDANSACSSPSNAAAAASAAPQVAMLPSAADEKQAVATHADESTFRTDCAGDKMRCTGERNMSSESVDLSDAMLDHTSLQ